MKRKHIVIGSILAVGGIITWLVIRRHNNENTVKTINDILDAKIPDPNNSNAGQKIVSSDALAALPDGNFPIKFGEKSKKAYAVQQALNRKFGTSIDLDGKYGDTTFQTMCDKVWNTHLYTAKAVVCYDITSTGPVRRPITAADFEAIKQ